MAGKGVRVLVTPTSDLGKILACMHGLFLLFNSGEGVGNACYGSSLALPILAEIMPFQYWKWNLEDIF